MKLISFILCAFISLTMDAQTMNVSYTRPASPEGRMVTVEDVTTLKDLRVRPDKYVWTDGGHSYAKADKAPEVEPAWPSAYTKDGSLYIRESKDSEPKLIVRGGEGIVYGTSVSRNEFGISNGIFFSPDRSKVAFYRKDESKVTDFPLLDITSRTGKLMNLKYPMNGMDSERISLGIYDFKARSITYVKVDDFEEDRYLTNISWDPSSEHVFIQVLDRSQHHMRLNMYDAADGSFVRTILTEDNDAWVEPYAPLHFVGDKGHFIYSIDNRDGYKSLYLCDLDGGIRRLTTCEAETAFVAYKNGYVYYTSREVSPVEVQYFRIGIKEHRSGALAKAKFGQPQRITPAAGVHKITFSPDGEYFFDAYNSFDKPYVLECRRCDGTLVETLQDAADPLSDVAMGEVRFGTVPSADGKYENYYRMFLPKDFDPSKKYPMIVYVYGGPHSQMVTNSWLGGVRYLELYWAQHGYVVYVQDNRGTSYRGTAYEKAINRQCGQAEMADQMVGIKAMADQPWVDESRIGVHGWSYGGFMTISLLTNYPDMFKAGVAGGPVIDWKWYEIMYGERYMDTEAANPEGFALTSLINKASSLKAKLLICQGAVDDTVVWEHSLSFTQKCIENNVQLDYFPYPRTQHNVAGSWRVHLNQKIVNYFDDYL